jgi:hypothetical protein
MIPAFNAYDYVAITIESARNQHGSTPDIAETYEYRF